jgi:hypothetical protein
MDLSIFGDQTISKGATYTLTVQCGSAGDPLSRLGRLHMLLRPSLWASDESGLVAEHLIERLEFRGNYGR